MRKLAVEISSPPERDGLVAEVWSGEEMVAEINAEGNELEIEVYSNGRLKLSYQDFIDALMDARTKLLGER